MNLYLFRNMLHGKVIVSKGFKLDVSLTKRFDASQNSHLSQIGEHRYGRVLRRDHWVPFLVLSGLRSESIDKIHDSITTQIPNPQGKYRLPMPQTQTIQWTIPEDVKSKTILVCQTLQDHPHEQMTCHWERDEYRQVPEEQDLSWPAFVQHDKLQILSNQIPVVPGVELTKQIKRIPKLNIPTRLEY